MRPTLAVAVAALLLAAASCVLIAQRVGTKAVVAEGAKVVVIREPTV
jgi:hypothetical protein